MGDSMVRVIAEMSGNHNGSFETALEIVRAVAQSGAHYLKLQTYTADTITLPVKGGFFDVSANHELWGSRNLYELYTEAHTPWEWHQEIFQTARDLGIIPFSTPFDESAVDFLEGLNVGLYKIASLEIVDIPLIKYVASTQKPLIISTGTATIGEIEEAVTAARQSGCKDLTLMLCTSAYPAVASDAHLARLEILRDLFEVKVGISDHSKGIYVSLAAVALGATLIERHVTLNREAGGIDSNFSLNPLELNELVNASKEVEQSIGNEFSWRKSSEAESLRHRPSIHVTQKVFKGEKVSLKNVNTLRPSGGLEPKNLELVLGKFFTQDAEMGTPMSWALISETPPEN